MARKACVVSLVARLAVVVVAAAAPAALALDVGDRMPPVKVKKWVTMRPPTSLRGKVVVVEFWASWCPPCKQSIPHLNKLQAEYKSKGVVVIGISREEARTVERFAKSIGMKYCVGVDTGETSAVYMKGIGGIPHAFVIDRTGKVAWQGHPMAGLDGVLEKLAGESPVASDDPVEAALALATSADLSLRDLPKALELARKAYYSSGRKDARALAVLARVHYEMGHLATAVKAAQKAITLADGDETKDQLHVAAEFYKKELERRRNDPAAEL